MGGLFITFEGSEGCGKSTQVRRLTARLERHGGRVLHTREPGGTPVGEAIRQLLQHNKEAIGMSPEAELLLFSASRAELIRKIIEPALATGAHVVSDRFYDSTTVYQGIARGLGTEALEAVTAMATGGRHPDRTYLLDLPVADAFARLQTREGAEGEFDRFETLPTDFFEAVRAGYQTLATRFPARIRLLDASESEDRLADRIWTDVKSLLNGY